MAEAVTELLMRHEGALEAHKALERHADATLPQRRASAIQVIEQFQLVAALLHCTWPIAPTATTPSELRASLLLVAEQTGSPAWWAAAWPPLTPESRAAAEARRARIDAATDPAAVTSAMCTAWTGAWSRRICGVLVEGLKDYAVAAGTAPGGASLAVFCARATGPRDVCVCRSAAAAAVDAAAAAAAVEADLQFAAGFEHTFATDPAAAAKDAELFARITVAVDAHLARNGGRAGLQA